MSAFVCSDQHLNYMLNAYASYCSRGLTDDELLAMGKMLRDENNASVNYRYEGRYPEDLGAPYEQPLRIVSVDPVTTLKLVHCYRYQSCEHDGWEKSQARQWCDSLEAGACSRLPGYEDAPWGTDEWQPKRPEQRALLPLADKILGQCADLAQYGEQELRERLGQIAHLVRRAQALYLGGGR